MNALKFSLSGEFACFRKPETNSSTYITFSSIHKVALLGILGAIIGLPGYNQTIKEKNKIILPDFYNKLENLKISIETPLSNPIQQVINFNNATGIASLEDGGNLLVSETVLRKPSWIIYILDDGSDEFNKIKDFLENKRTKFIPYLGRNDYPAKIEDVSYITLDEVLSETLIYHSLANAEICDCIDNEDDEDDENINFLSMENLPVKLSKKTGQYVYASFIRTSMVLKNKGNTYCYDNKNLMFI